MRNTREHDDDGVVEDDDVEIVRTETSSAMESITRGEVEMQIAAAHKYPRSISRFRRDAATMATMSEETAASCMYSMPRGGKQLVGPSVRLAEIVASAWGNLQVATRIVGESDKTVTAQAVCWDCQNNVRITTEVQRRITKKDGKRFDDDMISVTGNAAASIALRNAVFKVVPRSYVMEVYEKAKLVAVGDAKALPTRRAELIDKLNKMGITTDRILARVEKSGVDDIGLTEMELLIGLGTAIKGGDTSHEAAFPIVATTAPAAATEGQRMSVKPPTEIVKTPGAVERQAPSPLPDLLDFIKHNGTPAGLKKARALFDANKAKMSDADAQAAEKALDAAESSLGA